MISPTSWRLSPTPEVGVSSEREPQPLEPARLDALVKFVTEICDDRIEPRLDFSIYRVSAPTGGGVLLVEVPAGVTVYRSPGGYYRRRGDSIRRMQPAKIRRLLQSRGQSDAVATDTQVVHDTGINSLCPELWRRYASSRVNEPDEISLSKLKFLKDDPHGTLRATVGGVLLATEDPGAWLRNAYIQAVCYDGHRMDGNRQLDAQDISGPLDRQIRDAMRFVVRNRRVAARKRPARQDLPQYSERAVFEAVVNAVVHRDYAVRGSKIRLFMFDDRLELYSPGGLCNTMTTEDLRISQFTRNELLASRLGQCPVGDVPGAGGRRYFIERRGEGIAVIEDETFSLSGEKPVFELVGGRELKLVLPAASPPPPDGVAARISVRHRGTGDPLHGVHLLLLYPNKTYREEHTDAFGRGDFDRARRFRSLCEASDDRSLRRTGFRGLRDAELLAGQAPRNSFAAARERGLDDHCETYGAPSRHSGTAESHTGQLGPNISLCRQRGHQRWSPATGSLQSQ